SALAKAIKRAGLRQTLEDTPGNGVPIDGRTQSIQAGKRLAGLIGPGFKDRLDRALADVANRAQAKTDCLAPFTGPLDREIAHASVDIRWQDFDSRSAAL